MCWCLSIIELKMHGETLKNQPMFFFGGGGVISLYCANHTKHMMTPCTQNVEFLNAKAYGT